MSAFPISYDGTLERTADGGVIRFERHLPYPIRDVWDAITDPTRLAEWWLPFDADITVDLREGGQMTFTGRGDRCVTPDSAWLPRSPSDPGPTLHARRGWRSRDVPAAQGALLQRVDRRLRRR